MECEKAATDYEQILPDLLKHAVSTDKQTVNF